MTAELDELARNGVTDRELELAKGHVKADTLLSLEDSGSRMGRIGASLLLHGEVLDTDELARRIDQVTLDDVAEVAAELLTGERTLAVVGPFEASTSPASRSAPAPPAPLARVAVAGAAGRMGRTVCEAEYVAAGVRARRGTRPGRCRASSSRELAGGSAPRSSAPPRLSEELDPGAGAAMRYFVDFTTTAHSSPPPRTCSGARRVACTGSAGRRGSRPRISRASPRPSRPRARTASSRRTSRSPRS